MSGHVFCGVGPFLFRRKASGFQGKGKSNNNKRPPSSPKIFCNLKKASTVCSSCMVTGKFVTIMELKNKISILRDLLDFPPCTDSTSLTELLIMTLKDISKRYSMIRLGVSIAELKHAPMHKSLKTFCDALKLLGDLRATDRWMVKCNYDPFMKLGKHELEKTALGLLDDVIKLEKERLFDESEDEEDMRDCSLGGSPFGKVMSESCSDTIRSPLFGSPATPTSVLPEFWKASFNQERCSSPPLPLPLRAHAIRKLSPIDLKRVSFLMFPQGICVAQDPNYLVPLNKVEGDVAQDLERNEKGEVIRDKAGEISVDDSVMDCMEKDDGGRSSSVMEIDNEEIDRINILDTQQVAAPVELVKEMDCVPVLPPGLPAKAAEQEVSQPESLPASPSPNAALPLTPPLPPPPPAPTTTVAPKHLAGPSPPPHPPLSMALSNGVPQSPPPPVKGSMGPLPPPPSPTVNGGRSSSVMEIDDEEIDQIDILDAQQVAAPVELVKEMDYVPLLPPELPANAVEQEVSQPESLPVSPPPPPPLVPTTTLAPKHLAGPSPPPHPRLPMALSNGVPQSQLPLVKGTMGPLSSAPSPMDASKGSMPMPLPSKAGGSAAPPPPPGSAFLRLRKPASKLKRSSQIGNLYRLLKGKVEGSSLEDKSIEGKKSKVGASPGGQQGMADALAEMTKKSAYFKQIEEDIKNHATVIKELKIDITSFQTSDMNKLVKFHKHVESHLEKLTDETQVLSRFEDFPSKKLEALRMAVSMYNKLDTIATTLQNWPTELPLGQLLDKSESYFTKIKVELDALERTKDEEAKKFQAHKITFDFGILIRIKELIVDVSSNCMEMALKEANAKQNDQLKAEAKNNGLIKLLWRAFQFAFRVYTFAGGQDDRAERLTRELAHEIEISQ